jgi:hypothetical protein
MLVDTTFRTGAQDYQLTEIHHLGEHIVRVDIRRDGYPQQSFARVQILAATKQWTTLVTAPVPDWYAQTPGPRRLLGVPAPFRRLAAQLRERAERILTLT